MCLGLDCGLLVCAMETTGSVMHTVSSAEIEAGWLRSARHLPSPNYNERPAGCTVDLVVIHSISLPPDQYDTGCVEALFCNRLDWSAHPYFETIRGLQVSAHLLIARSGALTQFVSFDQRAWHAGRSAYRGRPECNDYSVGIELEGSDHVPYTELQYRQLETVLAALRTQYPTLAEQAVAGHCHVAAGRKTDPGPAFDWARLGVDPGVLL
jgi:AmpD protein